MVEVSVVADELEADNAIETAEPDDETEAETMSLDEKVPEDDVMDEAVKGTVFEVLVKPGMYDESDDNTTVMEEEADKPQLEYVVTEDSTGDVSLVEDINVLTDPLGIADEVELATLEETGDMVDAAEDESGVESRLFV